VKRRVNETAQRRRRVVAVIGSGRSADAHCAELGRMIASLGVDLLTGGGRGVMEAASRAFFETAPRRGVVIGVVPGYVAGLEDLEERSSRDIGYDLQTGYPNNWVEVAIYTHLPDSGPDGTSASSRNHINVLSADAIVALPGREGTEAEMWLATRYGVPIVAYGDHGGGVPHGIQHAPSIAAVRDFLVRSLAPEADPFANL
jgi:predicted Rossmann-fold nucleotide-binding protein